VFSRGDNPVPPDARDLSVEPLQYVDTSHVLRVFFFRLVQMFQDNHPTSVDDTRPPASSPPVFLGGACVFPGGWPPMWGKPSNARLRENRRLSGPFLPISTGLLRP